MTTNSTTAAVWVTSIVIAATLHWKLPIFFKVALVYVLSGTLAGYALYGSIGAARAFGYSIPPGLVTATAVTLMIGTDWLIGQILFVGLAGLMLIGMFMLLIK